MNPTRSVDSWGLTDISVKNQEVRACSTYPANSSRFLAGAGCDTELWGPLHRTLGRHLPGKRQQSAFGSLLERASKATAIA